jgi:hypothetical protein
MINDQNAYTDDLLATSWLGEVMDVADPQKMGRIKVKVFGKLDDIPVDDMPWAYPGNNHTGGSDTGGGFYSVPKVGSLVSIKFDCGNLGHPEYFFLQNISDQLRDEIKGSYTNAHSLIYDTITEGFVKVYFTEKKGLMLDYKNSQINIRPDKSIILHTDSRNSIVEMLNDGTMNIYHKNNINIIGDAKLNVTIKGDTTITTSGKTLVKTSATTDIESGGAITIKSGASVTINHASSISLGAGAAQSLVLGEKFMALFNKHTHTGNLGSPTSPPNQKMTPGELSQKSVKTL